MKPNDQKSDHSWWASLLIGALSALAFLAFITLICLLLSVPPKAKGEDLPTGTAPSDTLKLTLDEAPARLSLLAEKTNALITATTAGAFMWAGGGEGSIMRISSPPMVKNPPPERKNPNEFYFHQEYSYLRPTKPEEIKAEIWTKDGRHWVAKWEEVKP